MSRRILAIDLRDQYLSAVLLTAGIKSIVIEDFALISFDQTDATVDALQQALTNLAGRIAPEDAAVVLGLPAERCLYRTLTLPFRDEKKIRQILAFELEPNLPLPIDDLVIDCQVTQQGDGAHVLAAAIERQDLTRLLDTFERAGFHLQLVTAGSFCLAAVAALHSGELPEHYLILDVDAQQATILALTQNQIKLIRSTPMDPEADEAMPVLAAKIRQTLLGYVETIDPYFSPELLLVTGSRDAATRAALHLGQTLGFAVQQLDLARMMPRLDMAAVKDHWQPMSGDGALALALMEIEGRATLSFHRTGSALGSLWADYKPYLRGPGILIALVLILFLSSVFLDIHRRQQRLDSINAEIAATIRSAFPDASRIIDRPADQMRSRLEEYKKNLVDPSQSGNQARVIDILNEISQLVPEEVPVALDRLVFGGDGITISGETNDFKIVEEIKNRLEGSAMFDTVAIAALNRDTSGNNVRFRLKIDL